MNSHPPSPPEIANLITRLHKLSRNLWWTWHQESQEIFQELSPRCWQKLYHNAVAVLNEVSLPELRARLADPSFANRVREVLNSFDAYLNQADTWGARHAPALAKNPVAYFSAEFGWHEALPIAAGGLGVLAGDHSKSASDLDLGFVGISLFYREGYFQQAINHENWQTEFYNRLHPENLPMEPVVDGKGQPVTCRVRIATSEVAFRVWRVNVGRCPVYLLDTDLPENEQHYRDLTLRVYGGDSTTRIMQEIVLGVGGVRVLRALGIEPSVFHMNEGHAAFLTLELMREKLAAGLDYQAAFAATRQECIFTTHTPVEAGHDRFSPDLMNYAGLKFAEQLGLTFDELMALGRVDSKNQREPFCMTVLALKLSRAANGVSELHGQVSREMWHCLYPKLKLEEVPIGHVTNGVHTMGWMKGTVRSFWRRHFNEGSRPTTKDSDATNFWHIKTAADWERQVNSAEFWQRMTDPQFISDEEIWALRYKLRRELIEFARRRLLQQGENLSRANFIEFDRLLNPDALTIGFARRFATYKRAPLIFQQFEKIVSLAHDKERPVQFVFAGKAHPRDDEGKRFIQHIIHLSKFSELKGSLVFIPNYDIHIGRMMVSGVDVWLNNPRRPLEASGTSGMKTAMHGALNMSILDGWWRESFNGENGFAIGPDAHPASVEEQDRLDSENLYQVLTTEVIPTFYNRDAHDIPRQWIKRIRNAMATIVPQFSSHRQVREYVEKYYAPGK
jgi:glycogen phosphorylase